MAGVLDARQRHRQRRLAQLAARSTSWRTSASSPAPCTARIHGPGYSGSGGIGAGYTLPGGQAFADAFHTFAVDWAPDSITWSVDGNVYQRRTPADLGGNRWVFDHPFFMILNLAVGGYWPGDPDGSTAFPQQLVVDYVQVTGGN